MFFTLHEAERGTEQACLSACRRNGKHRSNIPTNAMVWKGKTLAYVREVPRVKHQSSYQMQFFHLSPRHLQRHIKRVIEIATKLSVSRDLNILP
jgi:hypothetical protein